MGLLRGGATLATLHTSSDASTMSDWLQDSMFPAAQIDLLFKSSAPAGGWANLDLGVNRVEAGGRGDKRSFFELVVPSSNVAVQWTGSSVRDGWGRALAPTTKHCAR